MSMHEGLPVAGYQPQTTTAVDLVNENKIAEEKILRVIDRLSKGGLGDPRFLAIARTQIEMAFMALNRAIFQPSRISLEGDP